MEMTILSIKNKIQKRMEKIYDAMHHISFPSSFEFYLTGQKALDF